MNDNIYEYIILNKTISIKTLSFTLIILFVFILLIIYSFNKNYEKYYTVVGCYNDSNVSLYVEIDKINSIIKNNYLLIDNKKYEYIVYSIDEEIINDNNKNYQKVNIKLNLDDKYRINNYLFEVKILKERKKVILYLKDILKGGNK